MQRKAVELERELKLKKTTTGVLAAAVCNERKSQTATHNADSNCDGHYYDRSNTIDCRNCT